MGDTKERVTFTQTAKTTKDGKRLYETKKQQVEEDPNKDYQGNDKGRIYKKGQIH
jgi:hypothetical protein